VEAKPLPNPGRFSTDVLLIIQYLEEADWLANRLSLSITVVLWLTLSTERLRPWVRASHLGPSILAEPAGDVFMMMNSATSGDTAVMRQLGARTRGRSRGVVVAVVFGVVEGLAAGSIETVAEVLKQPAVTVDSAPSLPLLSENMVATEYGLGLLLTVIR
jgi:hypothetical protein